MQNTYHPIAAQIAKLESAKRSHLFKQEIEVDQTKYEDEVFLKVLDFLKEKFEVTFQLMGFENFRTLVYEYLRTNPIQSSQAEKFGVNFPKFLGDIPQMKSFYFVKYIAMLDWFWFSADSPKVTIQLPEGTLKSWGIIARGEDFINIAIDESQVEVLRVVKRGKEYSIEAV